MKFEHKIVSKDHRFFHHNVNTDDKFFKNVFELGGFVAGGYARYVVSKNVFAEPNDIDIFCRTIEDEAKLLRFFNSVGKVQFKSDLATSYRVYNEYSYILKKVQLIKPRQEGNIKTFGTPEEVIDNFDFTINMVAFDDQGFYHCETFFEDLKAHRLEFNNIHCAVGILTRIRKYLNKGYKIDISEFLKIYQMWDTVDQKTKDIIKSDFSEKFMNVMYSEDPKEKSARDKRIFKIFYID